MRKSSDEDELDEDEGKASHHAHIVPSCRGEEEERRIHEVSPTGPTGPEVTVQQLREACLKAGLHCPLAEGYCKSLSKLAGGSTSREQCDHQSYETINNFHKIQISQQVTKYLTVVMKKCVTVC